MQRENLIDILKNRAPCDNQTDRQINRQAERKSRAAYVVKFK